MTLANTVLFPHAMLPLYIFEPRYRQMLVDVLEGDRLFVIAREDEERGQETGEFEPTYPVASVGVVRACQQDKDGCSHLILQGLARMRLLKIVSEEPYRIAQFESLETTSGGSPDSLETLRDDLGQAVRYRQKLGSSAPKEVFEFLESLTDPETYLDLASFTLCEDNDVKQELLEMLDAKKRFERMCAYMEKSNTKLIIERKLQGELDPDDAERN